MNLHQELNKAFQGNPWHGKSSLQIVEESDPEKVFVHWIPGAHCIAEIVLHLTAWTEEAIDRLNGQEAKSPFRGDWPVISHADVAGWQIIVEDFKAAHQEMNDLIENFNSRDWDARVIVRDEGLDEDVSSFEGLVNGIIQHLAYHSGQISLLQKF